MEILFAFAVLWLGLRGMFAADTSTGSGSRSGPAAGPRVGRYGLFDHLRDSYRDSWMRTTDEMIARRNARAKARAAREPATGSRWQRRWDQAEDRTATRREPEFRDREPDWRRHHRTDDPAPARPTPQPEPPKADPPAPSAATTPEPTPDAGSRRLRLVPQPAEPPEDKPTEGQPAPTEPSTTSKGEPTVTGTGGEVPNFETHEAELLKVIKECEEGIDLCNVVVNTSTTLRGQVDDLQSKYGPVATATQTRADHLQGRQIDAETQSHAAEGADALDPNAVANYHDEAENIEKGAQGLRERLERAKAAAEAELANIRRRYADAAETTNRDLGGDGSYLGNGGTATSGTTTAPAPAQPEPAGATR